MNMLKQSRLFLTMLLFGLFGLSQTTFASGDTLFYGIAFADASTLDPHMSPATNNVMIADAIYNGLVRFQRGNANLVDLEPDLAERWESSEDGLTWTFYLRQGVQFHHGYGELTAEDVVFSLQKSADPDRSVFASRYEAFETIEALDPYTVRITLSHPIPTVLGVLADYHGGLIISKAAYEERGEDFRLNPVGTGAFQFESYSPGENVTLSRHEEYFEGTPVLERVVYRFMPDLRSRQLTFEAGEIDMMTGHHEQWWIEEMEGKPGVIVDRISPGEMMVLHLNMTREPLDNLLVRQAIAHAIDTETLRDFVGPDITLEAPSIIPPLYLGHTEDVTQYPFDLERSRELLGEAGYPNGVDLGNIVISEHEVYLPIMEVIQDQLAQVGIRMNLQVVDHSTFHARIRDDVNALVLYSAARFPIADTYLREFFHSSAIVGTPTAVTNFSHYSATDDYIDAAAVEADQERQLGLWEQAQRQAMEDLPAIPLFTRQNVHARQENVDTGYELITNLIQAFQITHETRFR